LSVLIESKVDCEFSNTPDFNRFAIGALVGISESGNKKYLMSGDEFSLYKYCRPRMDHPQSWEGSDNPLPSGLIVKVKSVNLDWSESSVDDVEWSNVIAFSALRLEDNHSWPWWSVE